MDIAALSMGLSQMKVAQEASVSVLKMAMDTAKVQSVDMVQLIESSIKTMESSVSPHIGGSINISL
jgi:hypothetical protein